MSISNRNAIAFALLGTCFALPPTLAARADDRTGAPAPRPVARSGSVTLGGGAVRFRASHDRATGRLLLRLAERNPRLASVPVAVLRAATGPRQVALVPVENETGAWLLADELLRAERFDGTLRVVADGRTIEGPLVLVADAVPAPAHGGRMLLFEGCGLHLEVLQDRTEGLLTFFAPPGVDLERPPLVSIREGGGLTIVEAHKVAGKAGEWRIESRAFTSATPIARVRIQVDGKPCETFLTKPLHGGILVMARGGPQVEVVRTARGLRVYVLEDRLAATDDKPLAIENPVLVLPRSEGPGSEGPRTLALVPVANEPLAWEIVELPASIATHGTAVTLRMNLSGRTVETDLSPAFSDR